MLVRNIKEFKKLTYQKKIICFDYGKKKIGVAISDENHKMKEQIAKKDETTFYENWPEWDKK